MRNPFLPLLYGLDSNETRIQNVAIAIVKDWDMQQEYIETAFVACASQLSDKTCQYASMISLVLQHNQSICQVLIDQLSGKFSEGSQRECKIIAKLIAELAVVGVFNKDDLTPFYKQLIKHKQFSLLFAGLSHCPQLSTKDFKPVLEYFKQQSDSLAQRHFTQVHSMLKGIEAKTFKGSSVLSRPSIVVSVSPLSFPKFQVEDHEAKVIVPFCVFDEELNVPSGAMVKALPAKDSIDHYILYQQIEDVLVVFAHNHQEGVKYFQGIEQSPKFSYLQALTEILVDQILAVPGPYLTKLNGDALSPQYFQTWIIDLLGVGGYPQVLGKVFYVLFERLSELQFSSQLKFAGWFALHISNFNFQWNWKAWLPLVEASELHQQFIKNVLNQCVELSYYERVDEAIPIAQLKPYMPPQPEPCFEYADGASEEDKEFVAKVQAAMKAKTSLVELASDDKLDIIMQCILLLGSKSISHLSNAIQRNSDVLAVLAQHASGNADLITQQEVKILNVVQSFWSKNPMFVRISIEKLLIHSCIQYKSVAVWYFQSQSKDYQILELVMQRLVVVAQDPSTSDEVMASDSGEQTDQTTTKVAKTEQLTYLKVVLQGLMDMKDQTLLFTFAKQFSTIMQSYRHSLELLLFKDKSALLEDLLK